MVGQLVDAGKVLVKFLDGKIFEIALHDTFEETEFVDLGLEVFVLKNSWSGNFKRFC